MPKGGGLRWSDANWNEWKAKEARREAESRAPLKLTAPEVPESAILAAVKQALDMHPAVAWVARMNSGVVMVGDGAKKRPFRAAFVGCSDLLGQMADGRFLAVECKRVNAYPTPEQAAFMARVIRHGGVAFVARGVDDVIRELG